MINCHFVWPAAHMPERGRETRLVPVALSSFISIREVYYLWSNINGSVGPIVLTKMVLHKHKWSGSRNGKGQLYIELKLRHKLYASRDTQKYSFHNYYGGNDTKFSKRCR